LLGMPPEPAKCVTAMPPMSPGDIPCPVRPRSQRSQFHQPLLFFFYFFFLLLSTNMETSA
jgi:hypothetical protein